MSVAESSKKQKERFVITLEKKVEIIKRKEENKNLTHMNLAKEYDIDRSTISNILQNKNNLLQLYNTISAHIQQCVHLQNRQFHIIDDAVYKLFLELHSHNVPVSQDMLKTKALSIYEQLKNSGMKFPTTFEASNELLNNYHSNNILNADETGLYFYLGPNKTLVSKSDTAKGYKKDKSCLTILLCCNASGTQKFKPFVIGKSAHSKYSQVNQPTILLADNCSAHSSPKLQNIKLEFLSPNTISVIQPCDAGIIKNFKVNYHKLLVTKWIDEVESGKSIKPINIKKAIYMIYDAWKQVLLSTIVHCWKKTKIHLLEINLITDTSNNNDIDELEQLLEELEMSYDYIKLSAEEYVEVNKHLQIIDIPTEESVVQDILKEQSLINDEDLNNKADDK
ncbi:19470_t:CDS:2 [Cetraspora pellucida]|uniref:19470_t:CDS:1 n=1 Tax=Cetraspora pellucida TaxID=1433469 RepID=A0A9N9HXD1_9GLOM|nr:19470_t:CDS:2 [Cetraspora pellucida]